MQEWAAYFSGMPRNDWPKAVDAMPTTQPEEGAVSASSKSEGEGVGQKEIPSPVSGKVRGKMAVKDELARKKRRTTDVAPRKPDDISLGGDRTTRMQSAAISEWLDDNEAPVAPPLSTKASSCNKRVEVQSEGGEGVPKQQAEETPTVRAVRSLASAMWVDPRAALGCSGTQRRFRTIYREADV